MMRLAVASIIAARDFGCLFAGIDEAGGRVRVRTTEPVWPVQGEVYDVEGDMTAYRDRWGREHTQLDRARLTRVRASGRLLLPWLKGLPGLGETRAQRLLERFGPDLLDALEDPGQLPEIARAIEPVRPALAIRLAAAAQSAYAQYAARERDGVSEARFYAHLEELGVDDRAAARGLWRLLGTDARERLHRRPYSVAAVLPWRQADHLGQRLLGAALGSRDVLRHADRLAGACDSAVRDMLKDGDTAATRERFLRRLTGKGVPAAEALRIGIERRKVLEAGGLLLAPGAAYLERDLHQHLERLRAAAPGFALSKDLRVREAVEAAERDARLPLTEEQRTAVRVLLQQRVGLLQGGAGTGKTTSMRVLVAAWRRLGGRVEAMALSGKAASKLAQSTSMDALTIAQALKRLHERAELEEAGEIGPSDDGPARGDGAPMRRLPRFTPGTLLLIDEASMVDVSSLRRLVQHVPGGASLLLVGDVAQLPPIGLGQVFHDLVHAEEGVVELTRTLRQDEGNPLRDVAAAIRAGRAPALPRFSGAAAGVQLEECAARDVEARLAAVRARLAVEAPADDILVVAARNSTVRSVCRGEMARRQAEGATGVRVGPLCAWVAEGDPVVMGANHYRFGLSNGQLGRVVGLDPLEVAWDGEGDACAVDDSCKADIMSAWAVTCHKSQGSEAARVAVALDSTTMLTRQWLYTSVTRARRQAVLVGPRELLDAAVARLSGRMTGFALLARGGTGSA